MEEEYHALCTIKTAADRLAEKGVLSCVAERAMSWLRLSYKKIHDKDLPRQACKFKILLVFKMGTAGCKESRVRQPGASRFCDRASEFCALLARRASEDFSEN